MSPTASSSHGKISCASDKHSFFPTPHLPIKTRNGLYLTASKLETPNPSCFVCRNATIPLILNVQTWTLERLLKTVVKDRLGFEAPTVLIDGDLIWEEGEGADSEEFMVNLPKTLDQLPCGGIQHGSVFELDDATQNLTIQISVTHQVDWPDQPEDEREEFPFVVGGAPPKSAPAAATTDKPAENGGAAASLPAVENDDDDDDDIVVVMDADKTESAGQKRRAERGENSPAAKKRKVAPGTEVIEID